MEKKTEDIDKAIKVLQDINLAFNNVFENNFEDDFFETTSKHTMKECDLRKGKTFVFSNNDYSCEISFAKTLSGGKAFKIWFNGKFVKITKTFKPIDKKVNQLIEDYNLTETELLESD